jgi:hypothetical protein
VWAGEGVGRGRAGRAGGAEGLCERARLVGWGGQGWRGGWGGRGWRGGPAWTASEAGGAGRAGQAGRAPCRITWQSSSSKPGMQVHPNKSRNWRNEKNDSACPGWCGHEHVHIFLAQADKPLPHTFSVKKLSFYARRGCPCYARG